MYLFFRHVYSSTPLTAEECGLKVTVGVKSKIDTPSDDR